MCCYREPPLRIILTWQCLNDTSPSAVAQTVTVPAPARRYEVHIQRFADAVLSHMTRLRRQLCYGHWQMTNCQHEGRLIWPRRSYSSMPVKFHTTSQSFSKIFSLPPVFLPGSTMIFFSLSRLTETRINMRHFSL